MTLTDNLKELRKAKNVSQEKLAAYLGVSYQAVSKWENGVTSPDIMLLPDIARYFGITVDELLQVEKLEEKQEYAAYEKRAWELYHNGKGMEKQLELWQEAYRKMPNNVQVKEMLMSTYFDMDKIKYKDEILSLASEIYADEKVGTYYKGQAIMESAVTYAANGNTDIADKWAFKASMVHHCAETITTQFYEGEELLEQVRFFTYWVFNKLCYMVYHIDGDENISAKYKQDVLKTTAKLYEVLYPNDDLGFEDIGKLYNLHNGIAERECELSKNESLIQKHLERAVELAIKSTQISDHFSELPLLRGWQIDGTPSENGLMWVNFMKGRLNDKLYLDFKEKEWFVELHNKIDEILDS